MILTSMPRLMMWRTASWMARPSVTLPPALLMKRVIGRSFSFASSRSRSMHVARRVLLDVADEIDVAQPVARLLAELGADGVDELRDQAIAQTLPSETLSHRRRDLSRQPGRNKTPARG